MIRRPRFTAHLHAEVIENHGVVLASQAGYFVLKGQLFELVAPLIDGCRSSDDIVDELQGRVSAAEVYYALTQLELKGYIRDNG
jgi:hypothetical protein